MLHWLVHLWRRCQAWFRGEPPPSSSPTHKVYYPSNLHGRHR